MKKNSTPITPSIVVKSENHCPLTALGFIALCFNLSCGENLLLIFFKTRFPWMTGFCGRVHWLLGEGEQLFWLLSPEHLTMITQTIFAEYKWTWVHCTLSTSHGNLIGDT
jgi:hypothetical protein